MLDTKALAEATAEIVREHVASIVDPLIKRLAALESRQPIDGRDGKDGTDGKDADPEDLKGFINERLAELLPLATADAIAALPPPKDGVDGKDGADADAEALKASAIAYVAEIVPEAVQLALSALPTPENGKDGIDGRDGRDADMAALEAAANIKAEEVALAAVRSAIAEIPDPVHGKDGRDGLDGKDGVDGKDGAGIADLIIDREGNLVCTMTDGRMKTLGVVVGKDGRDGTDGKDGADGKDGEAGRDGRDLDDIQVVQDGSTIEMHFHVGDVESIFEFELPRGPAGADGKDGADAYHGEARGLFDPKATYRGMDTVSFNGSEWRAKHDDPGELPGPGWMLSASKGKRGEPGKEGTAGKDGVSAIATYLKGSTLVTTLSDGQELKADLSGLLSG
ncbi:hypothetical protein KFK14_11360 [Sphingobium phenoxybenzoativorans]|uniref:Collagen-like protein n=1 Tax=Sphingobium phenoxybenzoativorans TaxID=1592790 RepID=A0A975KCW5_9SPHN|nr:hypothetical protein [Sphingobium phenoxybenzoativorans]QUT07927.1 hypothetical protein KFK14_11360 [Sphingobium phenoxybenzoativorans]